MSYTLHPDGTLRGETHRLGGSEWWQRVFAAYPATQHVVPDRYLRLYLLHLDAVAGGEPSQILSHARPGPKPGGHGHVS